MSISIKVSELSVLNEITSDDYIVVNDSGSTTTKRATFDTLSNWLTGSNRLVGSSSYSSRSLSASYAESASWSINAKTASYFGSGINNFVPCWSNNTLTPTSPIYVESGVTNVSSSLSLLKEGNLRLNVKIASDSDSFGPVMNFWNSRGTLLAPTALLSQSFAGQIGFWGHNGTDWSPLAGFKCLTEVDISPTNAQSSLLFYVISQSADVATEALRISSSGDLVFTTGSKVIYALDQRPIDLIGTSSWALNSINAGASSSYSLTSSYSISSSYSPTSSYSISSSYSLTSSYLSYGGIPNGTASLALKAETLSDSAVISGDVTGIISNTVVEGIRGRPVSTTVPVTGDVLMYNGSSWVPSTSTNGFCKAWAQFNGRPLSGTTLLYNSPCTLLSSFNISSIHHGYSVGGVIRQGVYKITFTTPMNNTNYMVVGSGIEFNPEGGNVSVSELWLDQTNPWYNSANFGTSGPYQKTVNSFWIQALNTDVEGRSLATGFISFVIYGGS